MIRKTAFTGGVSYYPDHWPESDWETDLHRIREAGLQLVRFGEFSWSWFEPREGEFTFAAYDRFMTLCDKLGLKVLLCTPTASAPPWLLHRHPESFMIDMLGMTHPGGRRMVCYNAPEARDLAERAVRKLAEQFRNHPALFGWQIDNEPTVGESNDPERLFDYNLHTQERFRGYLREKYVDIAHLNAEWVNNFWSRAYSSWEEIEAPRRPGIPSLWLEWMRFRQENVAELIHWQRDLLRSIYPHTPIGINIPVCGASGTALYGQDYWEQAEGLDFVGTDIYVFQRNAAQEDRITAMVCDRMRSVCESVKAEFWVSETQGGPHRLPWRMTFAGGWWGEDFLRRCTVVSAAHGARKVIYFLWRPVRGGQEFGFNGLVGMDGRPTELTRAVPRVLAEARATPSAINGRPVAFLHHANDSFALASGYDPDRTCDSAMNGWHFLLDDLGYRVEYLNDQELTNRPWGAGDLLVMPYTLVVGPMIAQTIRRAADAGTTVVGGFGTGHFNEFGAVHMRSPGYGLDKVFGVTIQGYDHLPKGSAPTLTRCPNLPLDVMLSECDVTTAHVLERSSAGKALVLKTGRVYYLAFDMGTLYQNARAEERTTLLSLLAQAVSFGN